MVVGRVLNRGNDSALGLRRLLSALGQQSAQVAATRVLPPSCQSFTPNYSWVLGELTEACMVRVLKPNPRMRTHKDGRVNRTSGAQMNRLKLHTLNDTHSTLLIIKINDTYNVLFLLFLLPLLISSSSRLYSLWPYPQWY